MNPRLCATCQADGCGHAYDEACPATGAPCWACLDLVRNFPFPAPTSEARINQAKLAPDCPGRAGDAAPNQPENYTNMEPRKPTPSRRVELEQQRLNAQQHPVLRFGDDETAAVTSGAVLGIIIGAALGAFLVFMMNNLIEGAAASQATSCDTWYTGLTAQIASCKERASNKISIWSVGSFMLILVGAGVGVAVAYKTNGDGNNFGVTFGTIMVGAIGTWLLFILNGMIESSSATTYTNCTTWYTGNTAGIAACKDRMDNKLQIWNITSFLLSLASCGLGTVGGHYAQRGVRRRFSNRGRSGARFGRGRPAGYR